MKAVNENLVFYLAALCFAGRKELRKLEIFLGCGNAARRIILSLFDSCFRVSLEFAGEIVGSPRALDRVPHRETSGCSHENLRFWCGSPLSLVFWFPAAAERVKSNFNSAI